jgi:hypothetical protein
MTGPSATANIEGVLVRGAQGIRSLKLIPAPRGTQTRQKRVKRDRIIVQRMHFIKKLKNNPMQSTKSGPFTND